MSYDPFTPKQRAFKLARNALANARVAERQYFKAGNAHQRRYYRNMYAEEIAAALQYRDEAHGRSHPHLNHVRFLQGEKAGDMLARRRRVMSQIARSR